MAKISEKEHEILKGLDSKWKWIARDENSKKSTFPNELWLYEYKPIKEFNLWLGGGGATERFPYDNLFQFIQWEDEKPYNIQELIDEYESEYHIENAKIVKLDASKLVARDASDYKHFYKRLGESEETEVKNIEWLKNEVYKMFPSHSEMYEHPDDITVIKVNLLNEAINLINQLDEPEVLSWEWIEENSALGQFETSEVINFDKFVKADKLQNLLVPNQEKEQKYNVKFKVKSSFGTVGIFLYKEGDEVLAGDNFKAYYPKEDEYRLTEQEIRDFQNGDILFEHFAVKVEELEE